MKPSEALRIARNRIYNFETPFICYALPINEAGKSVAKYIRDSLNGCFSYDVWLRDNHYEYFTNNTYHSRLGRLQWIDWMINEYEKIGQ